MSTLIIGANGQIGRLLVQSLVRSGEQPRAMVRNAEQEPELQEMGAQTVLGDLEDNFDTALEGCNKLVFTAGSGPKTGADKTILVDMWGAIKAIDAARLAGIEHFVMVSSRGAEDPERGPAKIKHYRVCKRIADNYLVDSGLYYSILRPGALTNDPAIGKITTGKPESEEEQWIPRADVADAIAYCLGQPSTRGKIYPLFHGDQPIDKALRGA